MDKWIVDSKDLNYNHVTELEKVNAIKLTKRKVLKFCNRVIEFYDVIEPIQGWIELDKDNSTEVSFDKNSKILRTLIYKKENEHSWIHDKLFKLYLKVFTSYKDIKEKYVYN